jgi:hypothetical protein
VKPAPLLAARPAEPLREAARPCACGGPGADLRCDCGSLLARRVAGGVELKCRRCKRTVVLPLADG